MVNKVFLPIGSVVVLKKYPRELMITGILQYSQNNKNTMFDYIGVLYPEGDMGSNFKMTFNNEDIDHLVFKGYEDEKRTEFINTVNEFLKIKNDQGENK